MKGEIQWNTIASLRDIIIWVAIFLFLSIFFSKSVFAPLSSTLQDTKSKLEAKKVELAAYKKFLDKKSPQVSKVPEIFSMNRKSMLLKVQGSFEKSNMAPDVLVSELLTELTKPQYASAALLEKFSFSGEKKQIGFTEMGLDLRFMGNYDGIADYLSRIRELPYILRVDSIEVKANDPKEPGKVQLLAKSSLYVGEPHLATVPATTIARSDIATDLLRELNSLRSVRIPFAAKPREMGAWSVHELKLTSTIAGTHRPSALINGRIFELGDEIADFKLVEVRPQEVVLQRGEIQHVVKITQELAGPVEEVEKEPSIFKGPGNTPEAQKGFQAEATLPRSPAAETIHPEDDAIQEEISPEPQAAIQAPALEVHQPLDGQAEPAALEANQPLEEQAEPAPSALPR